MAEWRRRFCEGKRGCTILESEKRGPFNRSDVATGERREDGSEQERAEGGEAGRGEGGGGVRGEEEEREGGHLAIKNTY